MRLETKAIREGSQNASQACHSALGGRRRKMFKSSFSGPLQRQQSIPGNTYEMKKKKEEESESSSSSSDHKKKKGTPNEVPCPLPPLLLLRDLSSALGLVVHVTFPLDTQFYIPFY